MVLVCYSYVTRMYSYVTRITPACTQMYSYVTRMLSCGVLVTILKYCHRKIHEYLTFNKSPFQTSMPKDYSYEPAFYSKLFSAISNYLENTSYMGANLHGCQLNKIVQPQIISEEITDSVNDDTSKVLPSTLVSNFINWVKM